MGWDLRIFWGGREEKIQGGIGGEEKKGEGRGGGGDGVLFDWMKTQLGSLVG